jgi:hypothetical protein
MSLQWSKLSIWNQEIQITLATANKAIVFKSHATVNALQVTCYSMIAQKVTDCCGLFKKNTRAIVIMYALSLILVTLRVSRTLASVY